MAEVRITERAAKQLTELPAGILPRIHTLIQRLSRWPAVSGAKPLRGNRAGQFRLRTGDFRMIVQPAGDVVVVLEIGNRRDVYDE